MTLHLQGLLVQAKGWKLDPCRVLQSRSAGREKKAQRFSAGKTVIFSQPFAERSPRIPSRLFCGSGERELKGQPLPHKKICASHPFGYSGDPCRLATCYWHWRLLPYHSTT